MVLLLALSFPYYWRWGRMVTRFQLFGNNHHDENDIDSTDNDRDINSLFIISIITLFLVSSPL